MPPKAPTYAAQRATPVGGISGTAADDFTGIRPFRQTDMKAVRLLVGMGIMEGLKRSNQQTYMHPITLLVWTVLSLAADTYMKWWPREDVWWSAIVPLTGFGATAIPIMISIEYINRNFFESLLRLTLGATDLLSVKTYYALAQDASAPTAAANTHASLDLHPSSTSGFWVCTHHGDIIGCIALDGTSTATSKLESVIPGQTDEKGWMEVIGWMGKKEKKQEATSSDEVRDKVIESDVAEVERETLRKRKNASGQTTSGKSASALQAQAATRPTSPTTDGVARIRHFHVDSPYRGVKLGSDMLGRALAHAFVREEIQRVVVYHPPYATGHAKRLFRSKGFTPCNQVETVRWSGEKAGVIGFDGEWIELTRERWERLQEGQ